MNDNNKNFYKSEQYGSTYVSDDNENEERIAVTESQADTVYEFTAGDDDSEAGEEVEASNGFDQGY